MQINFILNFIFNKTKHVRKNVIIKNNDVLSPESKITIEHNNDKIIKKIFWKFDLFFLIMCRAKNKPYKRTKKEPNFCSSEKKSVNLMLVLLRYPISINALYWTIYS